MARQIDLLVAVATKDPADGDRLMRLLEGHADSGTLNTELPRHTCIFVRCGTPGEAIETIRRHLAGPADRAAVLVSDMLVEYDPRPDEPWVPAEWAKDLRDEFQVSYASIAVMDRPERVRDIDRTIRRGCDAGDLLEKLKLVAFKLLYIGPVEKRQLSAPVDVRLIRRSYELVEYFRLRHRVYRAMGYLDEEVENTKSGMEIDWCDTISRHLGAFERLAHRRERLIGTARVVIAKSPKAGRDESIQRRFKMWTESLAAQDELLRSVLRNRVLPMELPFFHSQSLTDSVTESMIRRPCAELSRVVVDADYRGAGLATRLVNAAIAEARRAGVERLFLECLDIHEDLYCRFGFKRRKGDPKEVIGVNKTMIAMELKMPAESLSTIESSAEPGHA